MHPPIKYVPTYCMLALQGRGIINGRTGANHQFLHFNLTLFFKKYYTFFEQNDLIWLFSGPVFLNGLHWSIWYSSNIGKDCVNRRFQSTNSLGLIDVLFILLWIFYARVFDRACSLKGVCNILNVSCAKISFRAHILMKLKFTFDWSKTEHVNLKLKSLNNL